jgi:acetyl esterase
VHGGGFSILSKYTHWVMGIALARARFVVFSVNYRLAPKHRYPAAIEDVCDAYRWVVENAHRHGADASRLVLAGESAGANLVTALAVAACFEREEPHARSVFETEVVPRAVMPACGMLQVTDPERFLRRKPHLPRLVADRIEEVTHSYLGRGHHGTGAPQLDLADPLVFLEKGTPAARRIPPFFVPCGTADPVLDDSRRLAAVLRRREVLVDDRYYEGEPHAFHAFVFRERAKQCWTDTYRFLDTHVPR